MAETIEFKCPNCDGAIHFDSRLQKMKCPYCDAEIELESMKQLDASLNDLPASQDLSTATKTERNWTLEEEEQLQVYACESCGGELLTDAATVATSCPYCDNPVVLKERVSGDLKPELVVPFKLNKQEAVANFYQHLQGKKFLPKVFKDEQHMDEIKGLYVPFWIFDSDVEADLRYKGTSTRRWSDGRYTYTEVNHFKLVRSARMAFQSVPVDASTKMDNTLMEAIEPFDLSQAVDFQTAYLAGYLADRYDQEAENTLPKANQRMNKTILDEMNKTISGFEAVEKEEESIRVENAVGRYVLLPVWTLHTSWRGDSYLFAMNGQTGRFVGDLPYDKGVYWKYFFAVFLIVTTIAFVISWFIYTL